MIGLSLDTSLAVLSAVTIFLGGVIVGLKWAARLDRKYHPMVVELIEADVAYDRARAETFPTVGLKEEIAAQKAFDAAKRRRQAALIAIGAKP